MWCPGCRGNKTFPLQVRLPIFLLTATWPPACHVQISQCSRRFRIVALLLLATLSERPIMLQPRGKGGDGEVERAKQLVRAMRVKVHILAAASAGKDRIGSDEVLRWGQVRTEVYGEVTCRSVFKITPIRITGLSIRTDYGVGTLSRTKPRGRPGK